MTSPTQDEIVWQYTLRLNEVEELTDEQIENLRAELVSLVEETISEYCSGYFGK